MRNSAVENPTRSRHSTLPLYGGLDITGWKEILNTSQSANHRFFQLLLSFNDLDKGQHVFGGENPSI
jgi:hypothetical protein